MNDQPEKPRGITNGHWQRIGEGPLGFGLARFVDQANNKSLWRLRITRHLNDVVIDKDAVADELLAIRSFCDGALKIIETDGGRNEPPPEDGRP